MKESIASFILEFREKYNQIKFDEAATKQAVVLRLLSVLGWDYYNIDEVTPEFTVGNKRVDYALRIGNKSKVFIEVKKIGEPLDNHQEQLLNYSFQEGVKLSILTNGTTWWFYLPLYEASWEQRRFYTVDLLQQESEHISDRFIDFLSRENIISGKTIEIAENLYKSRQKEKTIKLNLPKAWEKILNQPNELLVELLEDTTEKLSGFRPDKKNVINFLEEYQNQLKSGYKRESIEKVITQTRQKINIYTSSPASYSNKKIAGFTFLGNYYKVQNWKNFLVSVSGIIYDKHKNDFSKVYNMKGTKRDYYSNKPKSMHTPKEINNSKIYVETHYGANMIVKICLNLISLFGYSKHELKIHLR